MRLLQVSTSDAGGGAERVATTLHRAFLSGGHDATLAVADARTDLAGVIELGSTEPLEAAARQLRRVTDRLGLQALAQPGGRVLTGAAPWDVAIIHNVHGGAIDLWTVRRLVERMPTVLVLHDLWWITGHCAHPPESWSGWRTGCGDCPGLGIPPKVARDATRWNLIAKRMALTPSPAAVVSPSRWLLELLDDSYLRDVPRRYVPNPVEPVPHEEDEDAARKAARRRLGLPADREIVLFPANRGLDNPFKDGTLLLGALDHLRASRDVLLVTFGDTSRSQASVRIREPVTDQRAMHDYYRAADVVVYPSLADTAPLVPLEAGALCRPTVATSVGGMPELITDRVDGRLVPPHDVQGFARAVGDLLDDPAEAHRLARASRHRAESHAPQHIVERWLQLLDELI